MFLFFDGSCKISYISLDFISDNILDNCLEESWFALVLHFSSLAFCLPRGDFDLFILFWKWAIKDIIPSSNLFVYFCDCFVRKPKDVINIVTHLVQVDDDDDSCRRLWTLKPLHRTSKACLYHLKLQVKDKTIKLEFGLALQIGHDICKNLLHKHIF